MDAAFAPTGPVDTGPAAATAEAAGYAGIWTSEITHDPFLALAVAAGRTGRIQLGTAIALAFARNPMSTAVAANDLQLLSQGRLLLGLGSQIKAHITRRFAMPWSRPAARMREYILALRAIWACWQDGAALDFHGEFYTHTLMTPFFNPGPNPFGAPPVLVAGVGEVMTTVAGEVADGFLCHGFTTERYLREVTVPALRVGRGRAARSGVDGAAAAGAPVATLTGFEVSGTPLVATGVTEADMVAAQRAVRDQIAFYGSTPAYRAVLDLHGWGDLGEQLHALSVRGRWPEMGGLVDDDVLHAFAVVAAPDRVAAELIRRYGDLMTRMTVSTPYALDPAVAARITAELGSASAPGPR